jgi:hypothetical protein
MKPLPTSDWTVKKTLHEYPDAARIFIQMKTDCIGCPLARFCTLQEVELDFKLSPGSLVNPLQEFLSSQDSRRNP